MALPKIETPTFMLTVPGIDKDVKCRPFLVKEEKLLILGAESEEIEDKVTACSNIVSNCTFGLYNQENLAMYQLQWLFLHIKAKSTGDSLELNLTCGDCGDIRPFVMPLTGFEVFGDNNETYKDFTIHGDVGVRIKRPTAEVQGNIQNLDDNEILINCLEYVWNGEEIIKPETETLEELVEFIESIPINSMEEIEKFLISTPVIGKNIEFECVACKHKNRLFVNGYEHFFV